MKRLVIHSCLLLSWIAANGLQWDVLQWVAWTKMFVGYTQQMSVTAALEETFDVEKPCELCLAIRQAREAEAEQARRRAALEKGEGKLTLACPKADVFCYLDLPEAWPDTLILRPCAWIETVPLPPPRAGVARC